VVAEPIKFTLDPPRPSAGFFSDLDDQVPNLFRLAVPTLWQFGLGRLFLLFEVVTGEKKVVDVAKFYCPDRLRPKYESFLGKSLLIMGSTV